MKFQTGFGQIRAVFASVFLQCAAIMALTTIVVAGVMAYQSAHLSNSLARNGIVDMAERTVALKASALAAPLRFNAIPKVEETLEGAMQAAAENGLAGLVLGSDGTVLARTNGPEDVLEALTGLAQNALGSGTDLANDTGLLLSHIVRAEPEGPGLGVLAMAWSDDAAMLAVHKEKNRIIQWAVGVFLAMCTVTIGLLVLVLKRPLNSLRGTIQSIAEGDYDAEVQLAGRADEFGEIAGRLVELNQTLRKGRQAEAARLEQHEMQAHVVEALGTALRSLAKGDLRHALQEPFPTEYERLRTDYNRAVESLNDVVQNVAQNASSIRLGSEEIARSSDDLARRTENQAATLEETAAALTQLVASVNVAAGNASDTEKAVQDARQMARDKGMVMRHAVDAMAAIEKSSGQIGDIITVIDDIAFQTNLLALNAGVEAARAGSSGKGFAVVASEVRALAHRSSDAARQIKDLIIGSSDEVKNGVDLVEKAGEALEDVIERVGNISELVSGISRTAADQADGLKEINSGVANLDNVTQNNAAMVEEATAAAHLLRNEANALTELMGRFKTHADTVKAAHVGDQPALTSDQPSSLRRAG